MLTIKILAIYIIQKTGAGGKSESQLETIKTFI